MWEHGGLFLDHCISKHMPVLEFFQPLCMCPYALLFTEDKKKEVQGSRRMQLEPTSEISPRFAVCGSSPPSPVASSVPLPGVGLSSSPCPTFSLYSVGPFLACSSICPIIFYIKKLKIDLVYGTSPQLLGICPKEMKSVCGRDLCTEMRTVALSAAKTWN